MYCFEAEAAGAARAEKIVYFTEGLVLGVNEFESHVSPGIIHLSDLFRHFVIDGHKSIPGREKARDSSREIM